MAPRSLVLPNTPAASGGVSLFAKGFRPFFLCGAMYAVLSLPLWILVLTGHLDPGRYLGATYWHAHEMVFGFSVAIVAGFLLTAIENWTQRRTADGGLLAFLCALWLAGRVGILAADALPRFVPAVLDLAFLPALMLICARPIVVAKNRRNYVFLVLLTGLWVSNVMVHLGALGFAPVWQRLGNLMGVDLLTIALVVISGRVVPMFTRNATRVQSIRNVPSLDRAAMLSVVALTMGDAVGLPAWATGLIAGVTGAIVLGRMAFWGTRYTLREPLLWILHVGSAWVGIGLVLRLLSAFFVAIPSGASLHAITAGGIGALTLGMMTRVGLGHTGRMLVAPPRIGIAFGLISIAALLRVVGPYVFAAGTAPLVLAGTAWSLAFAIYLGTYARALMSPRVDNRPG